MCIRDRCLTIQAFQEAVHSQSYSYMLDSFCSPDQRTEILYQWKEDPRLLKRNEFIGGLYNEFIEQRTPVQLMKTLIANYILEGIYFYSGFMFFYNLGPVSYTHLILIPFVYTSKDFYRKLQYLIGHCALMKLEFSRWSEYHIPLHFEIVGEEPLPAEIDVYKRQYHSCSLFDAVCSGSRTKNESSSITRSEFHFKRNAEYDRMHEKSNSSN